MNELYKQHSEEMQRANQQWFNLFWKPFTGQQKDRAKTRTRTRKGGRRIKGNSNIQKCIGV